MNDNVELLTAEELAQTLPLNVTQTLYSNPLHARGDEDHLVSSAPLESAAAETDSEASGTDDDATMLRKREGRLSALKVSFALLGFISSILLFWTFGPVGAVIDGIAAACEWIQVNKLLGAMLFIPCEILWVFFCIPLTPLEIAAGYAFGLGLGFVVNSVGKLLGSVLSFAVGRHCLRGLVGRTCGGSGGNSGVAGLLKSVDHALSTTGKNSSESLQLLFLIQLAYIPVAIKNYGLSLTSVPLAHFAATAALGEAPGTLAAVWMGASSRDLVSLLHGDGGGGPTGSVQAAVDVAGALSLVLVMGLLGRRIQVRLHALSGAVAAPGDDTATYAQVT